MELLLASKDAELQALKSCRDRESGSKPPRCLEEASDSKAEMDGLCHGLMHDCYDPQPKGDVNHIKFSFGNVVPQDGERRSVAGVYLMSSWPHGVAVIINNERFQKQKDREGTHIDEKNLIQTLRYLGYIVEVYRNCTARNILDIMEEYRLKDHSSYDSFICCILSHGKQGQIFGSDSFLVPLDDITRKLDGDKCPTLASKPKMFFLQACRGVMKDSGVSTVEADDDEMEEEEKVFSSSGAPRVATDSDITIPRAEDFYFGYATASGHVAWRDLDNGSWYVSELCRSLASYARFAGLNDIMTITNNRVSTVYANAGYKQSTEVTSRLRKDVFFF